jgi:malate synthase
LSTTPALDLPPGCTVTGDMRPEYAEILTDGALRFVSDLARRFGPRVSELLARRVTRQAEIDGGQLPDFLHETQAVRDSDWRVTVTPADLADRRVEITARPIAR